jgi:small-conductance mechanosensitive channel
MLETGDIRYPLFDLLGTIVFWVVILIFCSIAAHALGLDTIERLIDRFVTFLPNLLIAAIIIGLGIWFGILAGRFTRAFGISAKIEEANLLGKGVQYLIIVIAAGTALEQLNLATQFLFGAFLILLGALGLAFGLAGKDKAREIIDRLSNTKKK